MCSYWRARLEPGLTPRGGIEAPSHVARCPSAAGVGARLHVGGRAAGVRVVGVAVAALVRVALARLGLVLAPRALLLGRVACLVVRHPMLLPATTCSPPPCPPCGRPPSSAGSFRPGSCCSCSIRLSR